MLDEKSFRYRKTAFVVKELAIKTSDYIHRPALFSLPPYTDTGSFQINYQINKLLTNYKLFWLTNYLQITNDFG